MMLSGSFPKSADPLGNGSTFWAKPPRGPKLAIILLTPCHVRAEARTLQAEARTLQAEIRSLQAEVGTLQSSDFFQSGKPQALPR